MATDCQAITIHTVRFLTHKRSVVYASIPSASETSKARGTSSEVEKHHLAAVLWDHLLAGENPFRRFAFTSNKATFPIRVVSDQLGKPYLFLGAYRGPAISFSTGGGKLWAALCEDRSEIGIDMAETYAFRGEYPFHRVFHEQEFHQARCLVGGDVLQAAALLWSVKEAVVKALGCAFHMLEPRQVQVCPAVSRESMYTFGVHLSGKASECVSVGTGRSIGVCAFPQEEGWFSIAS